MSEPLKFKTETPKEPMMLADRERKVWDILADPDEDADLLAEKFEVSHQTIRNVKLTKTHVAKRISKLMTNLGWAVHSWVPARRFTAQQVAVIRASTKPSHIIAKQYDCSPSTIRMIKSGQTYNDV